MPTRDWMRSKDGKSWLRPVRRADGVFELHRIDPKTGRALSVVRKSVQELVTEGYIFLR